MSTSWVGHKMWQAPARKRKGPVSLIVRHAQETKWPCPPLCDCLGCHGSKLLSLICQRSIDVILGGSILQLSKDRFIGLMTFSFIFLGLCVERVCSACMVINVLGLTA